jgi:hypothetical protein
MTNRFEVLSENDNAMDLEETSGVKNHKMVGMK